MQVIKEIDGAMLKLMFLASVQHLHSQIKEINCLNVFPVPDGDTGTNMHLTLQSAVAQFQQSSDDVAVVATLISRGSLMGARGNSGVILSQILRGISEELSGHAVIDATLWAKALQRGVDTAYKAVMKPVEGTILTVCKDIAHKALSIIPEEGNLIKFFDEILVAGNKSLQNTPNLLPVLKKAGVVDAGGMGLLVIIEGWRKALTDEDLELDLMSEVSQTHIAISPYEEAAYGYCTEYIVMASEEHVPELQEALAVLGDSLLVVGGGDCIKVHVHSMNPGLAMECGLKFGPLTRIKIENMQEQHTAILEAEMEEDIKPPRDIAVIAVALGEGIKTIFESMGVDRVIQGGQTMNPSTEDFLSAMEELNAANVIILPNNSNIIMAAKQTESLALSNVFVLPSKSIPEGLGALLSYNPQIDNLKTMVEDMNNNMKHVKTGQVTLATRDYLAENGRIKQGDVIGLAQGEILSISQTPHQGALELISLMIDEESEIITIFTGEDVSSEDAEKLLQEVSEVYPQCDVEMHYGGQPLYFYIISVE